MIMENEKREIYVDTILTKLMSLATTMHINPEGTSASGEKYKVSFYGKENDTFPTDIMSREDSREYELVENKERRNSPKYYLCCDCNQTEEGCKVEIKLLANVDVRPAGKALAYKKNKVFSSKAEIEVKEEYVSHYELVVKIGSDTKAPLVFKADVQEEKALKVLRHVKEQYIRMMQNREKFDLEVNKKAFEKLVVI